MMTRSKLISAINIVEKFDPIHVLDDQQVFAEVLQSHDLTVRVIEVHLVLEQDH